MYNVIGSTPTIMWASGYKLLHSFLHQKTHGVPQVLTSQQEAKEESSSSPGDGSENLNGEDSEPEDVPPYLQGEQADGEDPPLFIPKVHELLLFCFLIVLHSAAGVVGLWLVLVWQILWILDLIIFVSVWTTRHRYSPP